MDGKHTKEGKLVKVICAVLPTSITPVSTEKEGDTTKKYEEKTSSPDGSSKDIRRFCIVQIKSDLCLEAYKVTVFKREPEFANWVTVLSPSEE